MRELLAGTSNPVKVSMRINSGMAACDWDDCESAFDCTTDPSQAAITKPRRINKMPYKVLDAPQLQDDFYLNLVDWSS